MTPRGTIAGAVAGAWRANPSVAVQAGLAAVAEAVFPTVEVWLTGRLVAAAATQPVSASATLLACSLGVALGIGRLVTHVRLNRIDLLGAWASHCATRDYMRVAGTLDSVYLDDPSFYDRMQRAAQAAAGNVRDMLRSLSGLTVSLGVLAGLTGYLATLSLSVSVAVLLSLVPTWWALRVNSKSRYAFQAEVTPRLRESGYLESLLTGAASLIEIQVAGVAGPLQARHDQIAADTLRLRRRLDARETLVLGMSCASSAVLIAFALAQAMRDVTGGREAAAAVAVVMSAVLGVSAYVALLGTTVGNVLSHRPYLDDLARFLATPARIIAAPPVRALPSRIEGGLFLDRVTFSYPATPHTAALREVSLAVRPGQMLAVIGPNGAGKSTLVRLLLRMYDPTEGCIKIDDVDLRHVSPEELRARFGVLFQEFTKYNMTIRDHVRMGGGRVPDRIDDDRIWDALAKAGADPFVRSLDLGLDSQVGRLFAGGRDLSGGQWQRLALARLYYRDADVWVLDEPTASLDPFTEAEVFSNIRSAIGSRIGIVVSHRFATVRAADLIAVLADGTVIECGSHQQLLRAAGVYAKLFEEQAAAFK